MGRFFETRVVLPMAASAFIELRNDLGFDKFVASTMENQILEVELHETEDGSVQRRMNKRFRDNSVPSLLRAALFLAFVPLVLEASNVGVASRRKRRSLLQGWAIKTLLCFCCFEQKAHTPLLEQSLQFCPQLCRMHAGVAVRPPRECWPLSLVG